MVFGGSFTDARSVAISSAFIQREDVFAILPTGLNQ